MNELIVVNKPNCAISEEIKKIRTNIKFASVNEDIKIIMVTSSVPSEGKSFVSANLAASFAVNGEKTLIIDCDLRRGRQKKLFDVSVKTTEGLSNLLIDKAWEEAYPKYLKKTKVDNLYLLPTGPYPANTSELLASLKTRKVFEKLKAKFDVIILDCPPVIGLNDSLVISGLADMSLIVTKYGQTPIEVLEKTKKSLDAVGAPRINVVLNQVDTKVNSYYYKSYYNE